MTPYYADAWLTVYAGDCRAVMAEMPEQSVHCVVTSPPYWGLRDYGAEGQIGLETTPEAYVETMVAVFREVRRVLRDDGTVWLNVDDRTRDGRAMLLPARVILALADDGWFVASEVIWAKGASNGPFIGTCLPDGSGRRPDRSHEAIYLLARQRRYHYDAAAVRETSDPNQVKHNERYAKVYVANTDKARLREPGNVNHVGIHARPAKDGRRGLRSVWTVPGEPYPGAHGAVMPSRVAELCILAGCPELGVVLDPFAGSGTTGHVAQRLGRRAILIDLNPDYLIQAMDRNRDIPLGPAA
jgi:DNA modification methylase